MVERIVFAAWAALLLSVQPSLGQQDSTITQADRVRITLEDDQQVTGAVVAHEDNSLVILVSDSAQQTVAIDAIQRLELSQGLRREGNAWNGAAIGAVAGAVGGGLLALVGNNAGGGVNTVTAVAIGAGTGAIAGAIIGSGPKREQWAEVPLESLSLGYGPVGNGKWGLVASFVF